MVNSEEVVVTTEYMTLYARYRLNRCYNRVRLYYKNVTKFSSRAALYTQSVDHHNAQYWNISWEYDSCISNLEV
jgi:hypothetical protein